MKILVVSESFHPRLAGGEMVTWQLCTALARRGHEMHVVTSRMDNTCEHEMIEGVHICRPFRTGQSLLFRAIFTMRLYFYLRRILRSRKVDIVYNIAYIPTLPTTYLASKHGIPCITSVHSLVGRDWFRLTNPALALIKYLLERLILRLGKNDVLHFPSEEARGRAPHIGRVTSIVISNPIETGLINHVKAETDPQAVRQRLGIGKGEPFLLFVGSLLPVKNVGGLVSSLSRLEIPFKLVIVGDGPERKKIGKLVGRVGLQAKVIMVGRKSHQETLGLMASCDTLILPSRSEVFPLVVFETLALGKPVIATRVGCIPDIESRNLYLVDNLEQIVELLGSGIKPRAEERFAQSFIPDRIALKFEALFERLRRNAALNHHELGGPDDEIRQV